MSQEEQHRRFRRRIEDPLRQWKLSPMDLESYARWYDYSRACDEMLRRTDTTHAPWWLVHTDDKRAPGSTASRISSSSIPYEKVAFRKPKLGKRKKRPDDYAEPAGFRNVVPDVF